MLKGKVREMKKALFMSLFVLVTTMMLSTALADEAKQLINGAGSTFFYPVISQWTKDYEAFNHQQINYQGVGSSAGINQLGQGTLDFAASDAPQKLSLLEEKRWLQFPAVISGIVPIVNLPGVQSNQLVLDGKTLAGIFLGDILYWDARAIHELNPGIELPHKKIITVHRADGSGTTFNFTHYLTQVSSDWKARVGFNSLVKWPTRYSLGAKGNGGIASQVKLIPYAIGYVEYAYAMQEQLTAAKLKNQAGNVVAANLETFTSAAEHAAWQERQGYYLLLTNQLGEQSWPITAASFVLLPKQGMNYSRVLEFFVWCFANDAEMAKSLGYVVAPNAILQYLRSQLVANV